MQSETQRIATWCCGLSIGSIPGDARRLVRHAFLDTLAVTVSGSRMPGPKIVAAVERRSSEPREASVLGMGFKTDMRCAALINGTSAHAEIFDDNNGPMIGHPSASLVSALLPLAQARKKDGRSLLEAYTVGLEVSVKLGRALNPDLYRNGWHATRVLGVIGATAACCRLVGLDPARTAHAMGTAASMASSLRQNFGTTTMALHVGLTARDAIHAMLLAEAGLESDPLALEGSYGLYRAFAGQREKPKAPHFGDELELEASGLIFKLYPTGAPTLAAIDAALQWRSSSASGDQDIEQIICMVHPWNFMTLRTEEPATPVHARVNMRYCVSVALLFGEVTARQFEPEVLNHPSVRRLMKLIEIRESRDLPDSDEFPAELHIRTSGGSMSVHRCEVPPGGSGRTLSETQLMDKFTTCAKPSLGKPAIKSAVARLLELESLQEVQTLCETLEGSP